MDALIPAEDYRLLCSHLPLRKVSEVRAWAEICERFLAAKSEQRALVAKRLAEEFGGAVSGGLSLKTIYRRAAKYKVNGWRGLLSAADLRVAAKAPAAGIKGNMAFLSYWGELCGRFQRGTAAAFRELVGELRAGHAIPGYGDWRAIWRAERPGAPMPTVCPYRIGVLLPAGWSQANLSRHKPNRYALRALRTGALAAANLLPMIPRTRAGLKRGQIIEVDDMWHDVKVRYANQSAERCIELAMIDVATGYRSYILKPIRRRDDNTRELVMPRMMPYLLGYWLVCQGYRAEGALICGEHATAALSERLRQAIEDVTGGKVRFQAGGIVSKALLKGLYDGRPRGNFRFKARLEGSHALLHSELSGVKGQVGYTRDNAPEELYGRDKEARALQKLCSELAAADPALAERLQWPYIPYADYAQLVARAVANINDRRVHALEGWEEQGFVTGSFRTALTAPWQDLRELEALPPAIREAWHHELSLHPENFRARRLSPAEAWEARAGDVITAGRWAMPVILGDNLAVNATVSQNLTLRVKDPEIDLDLTYAAVVHDEDGSETLLERGQTVKVWVNPLEPAVAYIAVGGHYKGIAPVMAPGHQDDAESLKHNLGLRSHVMALEVQAITPILERRAAERAAAQEHNRQVIASARQAASRGAVTPGHETAEVVAAPQFSHKGHETAESPAAVGRGYETAKVHETAKVVTLDDLIF